MVSSFWDRYGRARSFCHRWPAPLKLWITIFTIALTVATPIEHWPALGVLACGAFTLHTLAGIPSRYLLQRLAVFVPMVLMLSLSVPLSQGFAAGWEFTAAVLPVTSSESKA